MGTFRSGLRLLFSPVFLTPPDCDVTMRGMNERNVTEGCFGLTAEQVRKHVEQGEVNSRCENGTKSVREIIKSNLLTYFNMVFVVLAILLVIAGAFSDLSFLLIIAANSAIGIFQELRSKQVLDRMNLMTEPQVTVIRDGKVGEIRSTHIVLGESVVLKSGMQIPADCRLMKGSLHVNESILTGESDEIPKNPGDGLLAGSIIISGACVAEVTAVSEATYAARLTMEATQMNQEEQSEILRTLDKMLKFFGILIIPLGIILFVEQMKISGLGFSENVTGTVAALIGMIPEGIYLTTSVALALSAMKLAAGQVLVHDLKCIETLARVDVLCVDKTGTITEKDMKVSSCRSLYPKIKDNDLQVLLADYAASMGDENDTMRAVRAYFSKASGRRASQTCPFSSKYKYSAARMGEANYVFGAPEYVLGSRCGEFQDILDQEAAAGRRVLAFALYPYLPAGERLNDPEGTQREILPLALIALENPIRRGAPDTFRYFRQQGVAVKVISGDNPLTVSQVARRAGIEGAEKYADASAFRNEGELIAAASKYTVFGRVAPEQKKKLVAAIQRSGKKVAMTGDGVNDIIAMKQSDCSIAMASGAEAASQAAQLVLLDSDFSHMPSIVDEGRRVVNNIQRAASLYLVKNIFSLLLAVFSVILMLNYPLNPSQITLISLFTIGIPSFVLALEPNHEPIRGGFLHNILLKSLPAGITDFLVVSGLVIFAQVFHLDNSSLSTSCSIIVAIVGFMILIRIMDMKKKQHLLTLLALVFGWVISMWLFPEFFGITSISAKCLMLFIIFAITTEPILRYFSLAAEKLDLLIKLLKERFGRG